MTDYQLLTEQLKAISEGVHSEVTLLANASALLYMTLPDINWAGFYLKEGEALLLGPFQGKPACTRIPEGRGVCGACASEKRTQRVADVHSFSGHIACDSASNAEIVVPLFQRGELYGVMDIDSPLKDRFSEEDQKGLEGFAKALEELLL